MPQVSVLKRRQRRNIVCTNAIAKIWWKAPPPQLLELHQSNSFQPTSRSSGTAVGDNDYHLGLHGSNPSPFILTRVSFLDLVEVQATVCVLKFSNTLPMVRTRSPMVQDIIIVPIGTHGVKEQLIPAKHELWQTPLRLECEAWCFLAFNQPNWYSFYSLSEMLLECDYYFLASLFW